MKNNCILNINNIDISLLSRFKELLPNTEEISIISGYVSGSFIILLSQFFKYIKKMRIIVGKGISRSFYNEFKNNLREKKSKIFNKIEIRKNSKKIHSKIYIFTSNENKKTIIIGSSNFTKNGLYYEIEDNIELNEDNNLYLNNCNKFIECKCKFFENIWNDSSFDNITDDDFIDITDDDCIDIVDDDLINVADDDLKNDIYYRLIYRVFKSSIDAYDCKKLYNFNFPESFTEYEYQKHAAIQANLILNQYNGVMLSDVVGLGKTIIAALLSKIIDSEGNHHKLIICSPQQLEYFKDIFDEFKVREFGVLSRGKLLNLELEYFKKYDYIFIDESHCFRNDKSKGYNKLFEIAKNKKLILITATPINNDKKIL